MDKKGIGKPQNGAASASVSTEAMSSKDDQWLSLDDFEDEVKTDIFQLLKEANVKTITANIVKELEDFLNVGSFMKWMPEDGKKLGFDSKTRCNILSVIEERVKANTAEGVKANTAQGNAGQVTAVVVGGGGIPNQVFEKAKIQLISKTEIFDIENSRLPISVIQDAIDQEIGRDAVEISGVEYFHKTTKKWTNFIKVQDCLLLTSNTDPTKDEFYECPYRIVYSNKIGEFKKDAETCQKEENRNV